MKRDLIALARWLAQLMAVILILAYHLVRQLVIGLGVFIVFTLPIFVAYIIWSLAGAT